MLTQSKLKLTPKSRFTNALVLFTFVFGLMVVIAGCSKDNDPLSDGYGKTKSGPGVAQMLVSGLQGTSGSTIGPDGDIYIPEGAIGTISQIDPETGNVSMFSSGLPPLIPAIGIGGAVDIGFLNGTAYALVTLVGTDVGGGDVVGIYRIDGPDSQTVIADIGTFNIANPPATSYFVPTGVQYAVEAYRDGFLVADGHLNRVLYVTTDGEITITRSFENIVPTGLTLSGNKIFMSEAGPTPHNPEDGLVISFVPASPKVKTVGSGAPLLVDVEFGFANRLFALSQGIWDGVAPGSPALPNTGSLVRVNKDGTFSTITDGLDRPTSLELIGNTAYVVTLTGEVWSIDNVNSPPYGQ